MRVMKTYLKARYRLSDLLRAQRNDRMTSNLKRWIENGASDKGDLEEDSYRILRQYFMQKEGRLYLNNDGIVACKRREEDMTDWDRYLPQVMGAYNSTQHPTTRVIPHLMRTGHEKFLPLTFFYPKYEGKKTSPQVYVRDVVRRQQELNDLCRRNTQRAQARQRKRFNKKAAGAKAYSVGGYVWVFQNVIPTKGTKKLLEK